MNKAVIPALLLLATAWSLTALGKVKVKTDRSTGATTIRAQKKASGGIYPCHRPGPVWYAKFGQGKKPRFELRLHSKCKTWAFRRCHTLDALVDGKPFPLAASDHHGRPLSSGAVFEQVYAPLTLTQIKQFAAADSVELRVCRTEVSLKKKELADIRNFAGAVENTLQLVGQSPQNQPDASGR